jgi:hypothetical protein
MLNWRRDPDHERRIKAKLIEIRQLERKNARGREGERERGREGEREIAAP